jgi:hypothetical protein
MVMLGWIFLAISFLSGCVAVPMPPFGERVGEAGTLHIRATVRFEPRLSDSEANNRDLWNALGEFQKTLPALKDK